MFDSAVAERSWFMLHGEVGSIALCNWYRPGASEDTHISSLQDDLAELADQCMAFVIVGNLDVHHVRWL